jgi:hypothetical protein
VFEAKTERRENGSNQKKDVSLTPIREGEGGQNRGCISLVCDEDDQQLTL